MTVGAQVTEFKRAFADLDWLQNRLADLWLRRPVQYQRMKHPLRAGARLIKMRELALWVRGAERHFPPRTCWQTFYNLINAP
jgi:hypothetical protein